MSEFPADWTTTQLQSVAKDFVVPMRDRPKRFKGSIPWIRIEDFTGKWVSRSQSGLCVDDEIIQEMNLKVHPQGSVLCSCSARLGVCAITERPLITNQTFIGIVPDVTKIAPEYLYYLMCSKATQLQALSSGTTIAYLPRQKFEEFEISIPPLPEQKKIAEILSGIDKMISAKSIRHEKRKTTAHLILESVLANTELRQALLSNIALLERGKFSHRPRNDPDYYGGEYPFIQTGDIPKTGIRISEHKQTLNRKGLEVSRQFQSGTIVITIAATIGEVGILSYPACFPDSLVGITPNTEECDPVFLHYSLRRLKDKLLQMAPQSAQSNLNLEILGKLDVPLPPLYEQRKFAQMICCEDERATAEVIGIRKLHDMKAAVASDLLSGRKRVSI